MEYGIAEKKGIEILYETAARSLILNSDGKVCGVVAKGLDGFLRDRCQKHDFVLWWVSGEPGMEATVFGRELGSW